MNTMILMNVLTGIAGVSLGVGLGIFIIWVIYSSLSFDTTSWPGILGVILLVVGIAFMIPSIALEQKAIDRTPIIRASAFTVEAQNMPKSDNKLYVVQVGEKEVRFTDFEIGAEEYVEYRSTEFGTTYAEKLVVSEDTAEALGRIKVGN